MPQRPLPAALGHGRPLRPTPCPARSARVPRHGRSDRRTVSRRPPGAIVLALDSDPGSGGRPIASEREGPFGGEARDGSSACDGLSHWLKLCRPSDDRGRATITHTFGAIRARRPSDAPRPARIDVTLRKLSRTRVAAKASARTPSTARRTGAQGTRAVSRGGRWRVRGTGRTDQRRSPRAGARSVVRCPAPRRSDPRAFSTASSSACVSSLPCCISWVTMLMLRSGSSSPSVVGVAAASAGSPGADGCTAAGCLEGFVSLCRCAVTGGSAVAMAGSGGASVSCAIYRPPPSVPSHDTPRRRGACQPRVNVG